MPQTTYLLDNIYALPGQTVELGRVVGRYQAAADIPPGRFVVLDVNGKLALPDQTTLTKVVGVAMYRSMKDPGPWAAGDFVSVLRTGQIWTETTGGTPADLANANVIHSSTLATDRGKATAGAVSAVAGSEVSDPGPCVFAQTADVPAGLTLLEINFPG